MLKLFCVVGVNCENRIEVASVVRVGLPLNDRFRIHRRVVGAQSAVCKSQQGDRRDLVASPRGLQQFNDLIVLPWSGNRQRGLSLFVFRVHLRAFCN